MGSASASLSQGSGRCTKGATVTAARGVRRLLQSHECWRASIVMNEGVCHDAELFLQLLHLLACRAAEFGGGIGMSSDRREKVVPCLGRMGDGVLGVFEVLFKVDTAEGVASLPQQQTGFREPFVHVVQGCINLRR